MCESSKRPSNNDSRDNGLGESVPLTTMRNSAYYGSVRQDHWTQSKRNGCFKLHRVRKRSSGTSTGRASLSLSNSYIFLCVHTAHQRARKTRGDKSLRYIKENLHKSYELMTTTREREREVKCFVITATSSLGEERGQPGPPLHPLWSVLGRNHALQQ